MYSEQVFIKNKMTHKITNEIWQRGYQKKIITVHIYFSGDSKINNSNF